MNNEDSLTELKSDSIKIPSSEVNLNKFNQSGRID